MPSKIPITPIRLPPDLKRKVTAMVDRMPGMTLNSLVIKLLEMNLHLADGKKKPIARNAMCHCGSGLKYKRCHGR